MTAALALAGEVVSVPALPAEPVAWGRPEPSTVSAIADDLGERLPPGVAPHNPAGLGKVHRLDLLARHLEASTAALAVRWLAAARRGSVATRRGYCDDLIGWGVWLAEHRGKPLDLATLTRDDVTAWRDSQLAAGRQPATIARRLTSISSLFKYASSYDPSIRCPVLDDDHRPRVDRGRTAGSARVLTAAEVTALAHAARHDVRDAAIVGLLVTTGIRVSELCGADMADLTATGSTWWLIVVRKGGAREEVAITGPVRDLLAAYHRRRGYDTGPLISRADRQRRDLGRRMDRHAVAGVLARLARAAGIADPSGVTPHSLRASAITDLIHRGRPLVEAQLFAGHRDVRTTSRYVELVGRQQRLTAMACQLGELLTEPPNEQCVTSPKEEL